jgi:sulfur carrier protein ThiS
MKQRPLTQARLMTGAVIASTIAAILAFSAFKSCRDEKLSVRSAKSTFGDVVKDINLPQPISAAEVNKIFADNERLAKANLKRIVKKGRKVSKSLHKDLNAAAKKFNNSHGNFSK